MKTFLLIAALMLVAVGQLLAVPAGRAVDSLSLAGQWRFDLDSKNLGISEGWFGKNLADKVMLPGSTDTNKKGTPNNRKPDLQHLSRLYEYTGAAWYQRDVTIPESWKGERIVLFLERCHWETQVWLDGKPCGMQDSLVAPHVHELGTNLAPGVHKLTIRVDNTIKYNVGGWAHSITEETQTNWNGIVGRIELQATPPVWIENVQVYPNLAEKTIRVKAWVRGKPGLRDGHELPYGLSYQIYKTDEKEAAFWTGVDLPNGKHEITDFSGEQPIEFTVPMPKGTQAWDEFSPNLYSLAVLAGTFDATYLVRSDVFRTNFGMRNLKVKDKRITVNGRNIFLRGTLECCIFPKTGYPPTDVDSWLRIFKIAKSYGLNHMRFHSWCPPDAAFQAADQMGFLLHVELPQWVGDAGKDKPRDEFITAEMMRILDTYGNHPSFGMLCMGNELRGDEDFLQRLVVTGKKHDPRHLYTPSTAWSHGENDDYDVGGGRGLHGPTTDADFAAADAKFNVPVVTHEVGQWSVFPNMAEIPKYTGVTRARNFELVRNMLKENGMLDQAAAFTQASGRLSAELYKEEIEVLLRTPGHGGFQLLDLHDFPGQGTALVGILDAFWDSKGIIKPEEWRRFCGPTVPLLRMSKRTWTTAETFSAKAQLAHFGPKSITAEPVWNAITQDGTMIASGTLPEKKIPTGDLYDLGSISLPLAKLKTPIELTITVSLKGTNASNSWNIWVYPSKVDLKTPADVTVTQSLNDALSGLRSGKKVLLLARRKDLVDPGTGAFTPVFWSPILFRTQAKQGLGILCDPKHPALAEFPTDFYTNWQWYDLLQGSWNMNLTATPKSFRPIVQVIDNFIKNRKMGNLIEARVGNGKLMVCTMPINRQPMSSSATQMYKSIADYMASSDFQPKQELTVEQLKTIIGEERLTAMHSLEAVVAGFDSEDVANPAINAIDGDSDTIWDTQWQSATPPFPHEIWIDLRIPVELSGFKYLPRQDMSNGWFTDYEFYVSEDSKNWGSPAARGSFAADDSEKVVTFDKPCKGRFIRLVALKGYNNNPWAAVAELDVIPVTPQTQ